MIHSHLLPSACFLGNQQILLQEVPKRSQAEKRFTDICASLTQLLAVVDTLQNYKLQLCFPLALLFRIKGYRRIFKFLVLLLNRTSQRTAKLFKQVDLHRNPATSSFVLKGELTAASSSSFLAGVGSSPIVIWSSLPCSRITSILFFLC